MSESSKFPKPGEVTLLLRAWGRGDKEAGNRLMPIVYQELKRRAAFHMKRERTDHTLRPTELVHEAYMRLSKQNPQWENRQQFFAVAAHMMRRVLVDHARARGARKRGRTLCVPLDEELVAAPPIAVDILALDAALEELSAFDARLAKLVELRFFAGLTLREAGDSLGTSRATADRDWATAKAWLYRRLCASPESAPSS